MNTIMVNTRISLLAGLLLSGCASMPDPELVRAQQELAQTQRAAQQRAAQERAAKDREEMEKAQEYQRIVDRIVLLVKNRQVRISQGLAFLFQKSEEMFGPGAPDWKEQELYAIAMVERAEAGEITEAQMRSLIAEKEAEIHARVEHKRAMHDAIEQQEEDRQQALLIESQRAEEQELANQQAYRMNLLNTRMNMRQEREPPVPYYDPQLYLPPPTIRCTSRPFLNSVKTECQ